MRKAVFIVWIVCAGCALAATAAGQAARPSGEGTLPVFTAMTMDGKIHTPESLKGKIVVLNLWFISCPTCVAEIKLLNDVVAKYKRDDIVFLGLAVNPRPALADFLTKNPFSYDVVPGAGSLILSRFSKPGPAGSSSIPFPMHYVYGRDGRLLVKVQGTIGVEAVKAELERQFGSGAK